MRLELPQGDYRYEIRRGGEVLAVEEERLAGATITGTRRNPDGSNLYQVDAELDESGLVRRVAVHYRRGPFVRKGEYEAAGDFVRGNVSAGGSSNDVTAKLGRYREIDADLLIFRALTIAHIRARGQTHWTGRVVAIDSGTLVAATSKQSCRQSARDPQVWIYEPRMGDAEEITIDAHGRVTGWRDQRGNEAVLAAPSTSTSRSTRAPGGGGPD